MNEASRVALDKAFELAAAATSRGGQPWGSEAILKAARDFEDYLTEPSLSEPMIDRIETLTQGIVKLDQRLLALEQHSLKPTRQRSKSEATNTTPPDDDIPIDLDGIPTPVEF